MKAGAEFDDFLNRIGRQRRYSKYTLRNYSKSVLDWYEWLDSNEMFGGDIFSVPRVFAKNYIAYLSQRVSRTTLHNKISALRTFHRFLREAKGAKENPFSSDSFIVSQRGIPAAAALNLIPAVIASLISF